jgi:hypothetical protein
MLGLSTELQYPVDNYDTMKLSTGVDNTVDTQASNTEVLCT